MTAGGGGRADDAGADQEATEAIDEEDREDRVLLRIPCSRRARRMWNDARRYAPRLAGRTLAQWEVAELVAAEASSAPGPFHELWQQEPWRSLASSQTRAEQRHSHSSGGVATDPSPSDPSPPSPSGPASTLEDADVDLFEQRPQDSDGPDEVPSPTEAELERLQDLDAFELDAAMRRVRGAMQQRQSRLGAALGLFLDLRLHGYLGYAGAADYIRERLGMSDRTARELVRVAQAARSKSPVLASAYAGGELSWLRALTLLPVVRNSNATAWVKRAGEITLRRLADEVAWAMELADRAPEFHAAMPPNPDQDLGLGDDRQMCARGTGAERNTRHPGQDDRQMCARGTPAERTRDEFWGATGRIHVSFVAPASVSVLFRTAMQGFASPAEPRWQAFERMLERVLDQWRSQPRHRDPVFARDGYRCSAPGCSSRTNLHDHHLIARSAGGTNEMSNRTTLCAWHHLRAVHGGLAHAMGQAPDAIGWELGLIAGRPPLMRLRGERYLHEQA